MSRQPTQNRYKHSVLNPVKEIPYDTIQSSSKDKEDLGRGFNPEEPTPRTS